MFGTRIRAMREKLDELKENRDYDELFEYALYLAISLIDSDRMGRTQERVLKKLLSKRKYKKYVRAFVRECGQEFMGSLNGEKPVDEFYEEGKEFFEHFYGEGEEDVED